jgi:hypothetical protein
MGGEEMTVRALIATCNMKWIEEAIIVNEKNVRLLHFKIINALRSIASDIDIIKDLDLMVCEGFSDVIEREVLYWKITSVGSQMERDDVLEIMILERKEEEQ